MALTPLPDGSIALNGAPDPSIGSDEFRSGAVQVMQLEMTQDVIDELLQSARSGKPPQILFGRVPTLRYGEKRHVLETSPEAYRSELYSTDDADPENGMVFSGLISHSLAVRKAEEVTAGADSALEALKNNLASIHQEREAKKTDFSDAVEGISSRKVIKAQSKHLHKPSLLNLSRSKPSSPSPLHSPSINSAPPTSAPASQTHNAAIMDAIRKPMIHLLAVKPRTSHEIQRTLKCILICVNDMLEKIGKKTPDGKLWTLHEKAYRELDPYGFAYPTEDDRKAAIDSAIRAFDRMRIGKEDKLWQKLLPKEERRKGICLSRLNLQPPVQSKTSTPSLTAKKLLSKKGATTKKAEPKKGEKGKDKEPGEKTPLRKVVKRNAEEPKRKVTTKESTPQSRSQPQEKPRLSEKEARTSSKRTTQPGTGANRAPVVKSSKTREQRPSEKPSAAIKKQLNNKPKNPSPLSASPPVNASDFEDNHPVHKKLSASTSPMKAASVTSSMNSDSSLKRKANDLDSDIHVRHEVAVKQRKIERNRTPSNSTSTSSRQNGTPSSSDRPIKRKADTTTHASHETPKHRKLQPVDTHSASSAASARYDSSRQNGNDSPTSDSSTSPVQLSYRQTVELAQKFKQYYERYKKLYERIAGSSTPPSEAQRGELMKMHNKLAGMKREIELGARES